MTPLVAFLAGVATTVLAIFAYVVAIIALGWQP